MSPFSPGKYNLGITAGIMIENFTYGLATIKGHKLIQKYNEQHKNTFRMKIIRSKKWLLGLAIFPTVLLAQDLSRANGDTAKSSGMNFLFSRQWIMHSRIM